MRHIPLYFALILSAPVALGEDDKLLEELLIVMERFNLFNHCKPIKLPELILLDDDAKKIGLSDKSILTAAESRLRAARLYDENANNSLLIQINVFQSVFSMNVYFTKRLFDPVTDVYMYVSTWRKGVTGTHGQDSSYIMSSLSQLLDQFFAEYLRVNESACE